MHSCSVAKVHIIKKIIKGFLATCQNFFAKILGFYRKGSSCASQETCYHTCMSLRYSHVPTTGYLSISQVSQIIFSHHGIKCDYPATMWRVINSMDVGIKIYQICDDDRFKYMVTDAKKHMLAKLQHGF